MCRYILFFVCLFYRPTYPLQQRKRREKAFRNIINNEKIAKKNPTFRSHGDFDRSDFFSLFSILKRKKKSKTGNERFYGDGLEEVTKIYRNVYYL